MSEERIELPGTRDADRKPVVENRKARHDYHIFETYEAGIALTGTEVKSLRGGRANLRDSYAQVEQGELILRNLHISPYAQGNRFNHEPLRPRRLLMHRREIMRLNSLTREKGLTLVPLRIYFNQRGLAKVELALARGKREYDKREALAERDALRAVERALSARDRG